MKHEDKRDHDRHAPDQGKQDAPHETLTEQGNRLAASAHGDPQRFHAIVATLSGKLRDVAIAAAQQLYGNQFVTSALQVHESAGEHQASSDVCATPTGGGPVAVPYPNVGSADKAPGGGAPKTQEIGQSSGDNAGTTGGVVSGSVMGKTQIVSASMKVLAEGDNVSRSPSAGFSNSTTGN